MRSSRAADSSRRTRSSSRTSTSEALAQLFDSRSGHAMRHEREWLLGELVADDNRLRQGIEPGMHAIRILGKDGRDRLTFQHLVARLHRDDESYRVIDRVLDGAAAAAEGNDRPSDRPRLDALYDAGARCGEDIDRLRLRQDGRIVERLRIPALGLDDLLELLGSEP